MVIAIAIGLGVRQRRRGTADLLLYNSYKVGVLAREVKLLSKSIA
jgi:hypothetical protein